MRTGLKVIRSRALPHGVRGPRDINATEYAIMQLVAVCRTRGLPARIVESPSRSRLVRLSYIESQRVEGFRRAGASQSSYTLTPMGVAIYADILAGDLELSRTEQVTHASAQSA